MAGGGVIEYVSILAVLSWLLAALLAIAQLVRSLIVLCKLQNENFDEGEK